MKLKIEVNGLTIFESDVIMILGLLSMRGGIDYGFQPGVHVSITATNKTMAIAEHFTQPEPVPEWGGYHYGEGPDMICNDCGGEVLSFKEGLICCDCEGSADHE